jgi:hypothetical protein
MGVGEAVETSALRRPPRGSAEKREAQCHPDVSLEARRADELAAVSASG